MEALRKGRGLIAALVVALAGGALVGGAPILGALLLAVGLIAALAQCLILWRSHARRYDLNALWETPPADPEDDAPDSPADRSGYCPVCGAFIESPYQPCPRCGSAL